MTSHPRRRVLPARRLTVLIAACALLPATGASAAQAAQRTSRHSARSAVPRALLAAVAREQRSERALVADANGFAGCARVHRARPSRCRSLHRALQRAGTRLERAERQLARVALGAGGAHSASVDVAAQAPELTATGETLSWTQNPDVDYYVLQSSVGGKTPQFWVVRGNLATPPAVPGATVTYSVRTAIGRSAWSAPKTIAYPSSASAPGEGSSRARQAVLAAPVVTVSGHTLTWSRVAGVNVYVLASRFANGTEAYSAVVGLSMTPPAQPGSTVHYSVRTARFGSVWSPAVAIAYSSQQEHGGGKEETHKQEAPAEKHHEEAPTEKAHEEPPVEKAHEQPPVEEHHEEPPAEKAHEDPAEEGFPADDPNFQPGVNDGPNVGGGDLQAAVILGAKVVRVGFSIGAGVAELEPVIAGYAAKGIRVAPVAEFYGTMPTSAQAQNLASWAKAFGPGGTFWSSHSGGQDAIRSIEFGNETASEGQYGNKPGEAAFFQRAQLYATRLREAAEAIEASGAQVGLLCQDEDWTGEWMKGMTSAVPNLSKYVAGWTLHPYGGEQYNRERLEALMSETAEHGGSNIPIDLTEWGVSTDNGKCVNWNEGLNKCMTYQEAAQELKSTIGWISKLLGSRLGDFFVYQTGDQGLAGQSEEWQLYFGILQHNLAPKGEYTTAVEELLAS